MKFLRPTEYLKKERDSYTEMKEDERVFPEKKGMKSGRIRLTPLES